MTQTPRIAGSSSISLDCAIDDANTVVMACFSDRSMELSAAENQKLVTGWCKPPAEDNPPTYAASVWFAGHQLYLVSPLQSFPMPKTIDSSCCLAEVVLWNVPFDVLNAKSAEWPQFRQVLIKKCSSRVNCYHALSLYSRRRQWR